MARSRLPILPSTPVLLLVGAFVAACGSADSVDPATGGSDRDAGSAPATEGAGENGARGSVASGTADGSAVSPDGGSVDLADAGEKPKACERYGAHVAQCYSGSVSYYTGWCEWFLKGCPESHIDQCVSSSCADVKRYCGYC